MEVYLELDGDPGEDRMRRPFPKPLQLLRLRERIGRSETSGVMKLGVSGWDGKILQMTSRGKPQGLEAIDFNECMRAPGLGEQRAGNRCRPCFCRTTGTSTSYYTAYNPGAIIVAASCPSPSNRRCSAGSCHDFVKRSAAPSSVPLARSRKVYRMSICCMRRRVPLSGFQRCTTALYFWHHLGLLTRFSKKFYFNSNVHVVTFHLPTDPLRKKRLRLICSLRPAFYFHLELNTSLVSIP